MKIIRILNVNKEEIFDFFYENLKKEFETSMLKEGMVFYKEMYSKFNYKIKTKVEIVKFIYKKEYVLKYISSFGDNIVKYSFENIDDNKTKIIYEEKYISNSFFNNLNNMFMETIFYFHLKKKKNKVFDQIEKHLLNEREKNG